MKQKKLHRGTLCNFFCNFDMTPKYIDVHSHVNFKVFEEDQDAVIRRALDSETWFFNVGTQIDTSLAAIKLAHRYQEGVFAIIGLHPIHTGKSFHDEKELGAEGKEFTSRGEVFDKNTYRELLKDPKVVAIGECGLDYYHMDEESIKKQKEAFIEQIELANEVKKPLMIHVRNNYEDESKNAYVDILEILKKYAKVKGVIHFFEGSLENAKDFILIGFMISFTGAITYPPRKNGRNCEYEEIIKNIPLNMILSDTDSPYMAPVPYRGKRNEPSYVKEIVKKIAEIRGLSEVEVAKAIVENAKRIFDI
ncbi:hydrolase TatD [Candidatus Nomurabacteria bacterium CG22_combo_CG10-13_8_21_14_all_32_8]|uniref:Hydrolase TatD n=1 Tax=Candidatus Nomurabacteria bacterium CG22_combo_CG10-13_8_21_14_all_32_8 TaxID=1974732 RepID=A0A2H0CG58_9BACT|nr:MAG: hydrolase TatD [Candidatus Nomurabacteria bacterium CG22_combo_CG10-13_8_21_14_all_32_8]